MLEVKIPEQEYYDEIKNTFIIYEEKTLHFEHSLLSLVNWEMKYQKHFLNNKDITPEELLDYFRFMCLEEWDDRYFTEELIIQLNDYLGVKPTATTISTQNDSDSKRIITSELVYAYMANAHVPFECESWNIHRLFCLLGVIGELNSGPKTMTKEEAMKQTAILNAKRRAEAEKRKMFAKS